MRKSTVPRAENLVEVMAMVFVVIRNCIATALDELVDLEKFSCLGPLEFEIDIPG